MDAVSNELIALKARGIGVATYLISEPKCWIQRALKKELSDRHLPWLYVEIVQEEDDNDRCVRLPFRVNACLKEGQLQKLETARRT